MRRERSGYPGPWQAQFEDLVTTVAWRGTAGIRARSGRSGGDAASQSPATDYRRPPTCSTSARSTTSPPSGSTGSRSASTRADTCRSSSMSPTALLRRPQRAGRPGGRSRQRRRLPARVHLRRNPARQAELVRPDRRNLAERVSRSAGPHAPHPAPGHARCAGRAGAGGRQRSTARPTVRWALAQRHRSARAGAARTACVARDRQGRRAADTMPVPEPMLWDTTVRRTCTSFRPSLLDGTDDRAEPLDSVDRFGMRTIATSPTGQLLLNGGCSTCAARSTRTTTPI